MLVSISILTLSMMKRMVIRLMMAVIAAGFLEVDASVHLK